MVTKNQDLLKKQEASELWSNLWVKTQYFVLCFRHIKWQRNMVVPK